MLVAGLALAGGLIGGVAVTSIWRPGLGQMLMGMTGTHVLFGRAAGLSFGYAMRLGHGVVVGVNLVIETAVILIFYAAFLFGWRRLVLLRPLARFMDGTRRAAERHRAWIRRWGVVGLLLFVWFPFWMTGPLVGCVIGHLMGLRHRVTLAAVLGGTYLAIGCWALVLKGLHEQAAEYGPLAPLGLVGGIILIAIAWRVVHHWMENHARRTEEGEP
jgi:uncharacterized membrane protein